MSDLTRYRIDPSSDPQDPHYVLDTTLQDIADAWNLFALTQWKADIRTFNPELGELLDGLVTAM